MTSLTSRHNPAYQQLASLLRDARQRTQTQRTVLEGIHLCQTYVQHIGAPRQWWYSESAQQHQEIAALLSQPSAPSNHNTFCVSDPLFTALSQVDPAVGLLAVIDLPPMNMPDVITENCLLLDRVQDPGNVGTLMRTAAAAGHRWMICGAGCADAWSPKVLRAAMGAHFFLDVIQRRDWKAVLPRLRVPIIATDLSATDNLYEMDLQAPMAWLFGNEGAGVAPELLRLATHRIRIPQPGNIESLNVAAAAAICLFEQVRQQSTWRHKPRF